MRVSPKGSELLLPYGRGPVAYDGEYVGWREDAACRGVDGDLFMTSEGYYTRSHMSEALAFCDICPVRGECLEDAKIHGDHLTSVRGGLVPRDHEPLPAKKRMQLEPYGDDIWEMYCANVPSNTIREAGGYSSGSHNQLMTNLLNSRLQGPENASWERHKAPNGKALPAGRGWLISSAPGLYCVVTSNSRNQRNRVVRASPFVTLAEDACPPNLPPLKRWPMAYDPA